MSASKGGLVGTLRSIATALDAGGTQYLDGVRAATHVETLIAFQMCEGTEMIEFGVTPDQRMS